MIRFKIRDRCSPEAAGLLISMSLHQLYLNIHIVCATGLYLSGLWAVERRLAQLNHRLTAAAPPLTAATVGRLRRCQARLCDAAAECNRCFVWPVLGLSAVTFFYVLLTLLGVLKVAVSAMSAGRPLPSQVYLYGVLAITGLLGAMFVLVVDAGSRLERTARRTGGAVHEALNRLATAAAAADEGTAHVLEQRSCGAGVEQALVVFSTQVLGRVPVASCGLFCYDWKLVYSVKWEWRATDV